MLGLDFLSRDGLARGRVIWAALLISVAALAAYQNSFACPFAFDDSTSIPENVSLAHWWTALRPPQGGFTVSGRPLLNLSFWLNRSIGGNEVGSYHVLNFLIHLAAGLTLFGVVRRTRGVPMSVAAVVALIWTVHPLQTESVTYIVQRAESLMGLWYLLTLYCFVRSVEPRRSGPWSAASVLACFLGMATKEVMVSAPVMVFLYDRTFVSGSFSQAWRARWKFYLALASSWILLGGLVASTGQRGGTSGFAVGITAWNYYETQFVAIVRYLGLCFWPHPLVLDYGAHWVRNPQAIFLAAVLVLALAVGALYALAKRPVVGFLGFWFFAILAPTSLIPGNRQTMAEHRMYLALIPVVVLAVFWVRGVASRIRPQSAGAAVLVFGIAVSAALGVATERRNGDYADAVTLWKSVVQAAPDNYFARNNLGDVYLQTDHIQEAIAQYRIALAANPDYAVPHDNLGSALYADGRKEEGIAEIQTALRLNPLLPAAHAHLGQALSDAGKVEDAVRELEESLRLSPGVPEVRNNLGLALRKLGRADEAIHQYRLALELNPKSAGVYNNLGAALAYAGRREEAVRSYEMAVNLKPNYADAQGNLGLVLVELGRHAEAIPHLEQALRLQPAHASAEFNLASALGAAGRREEAVAHYERALALKPDYAEAANNLGGVLFAMGKLREAIEKFRQAVKLKPDFADAHDNLAQLLRATGQTAEAKVEFEILDRLKAQAAPAR
jgi:tetratricopeptide (TPR) repeat protein